MKCLPQKLSGFARTVALSVPLFGSFVPASYAQDAAAPAAPAAPAAGAADPDLVQNIENLLHYYLIGNYTLAATEATNLVARADDIALVRTAERMSLDRGIAFDTLLNKFRDQAEMKDVTVQLVEKINKIRAAHVRDPQVINTNINKLSGNQRERDNALADLQAAGEIAVPLMLDVLRDNTKQQQHAMVLNALSNLINITVSSLFSMKAVKAGDLFYELSERFYYNLAAIRPDPRDAKARVWFWDDATGLVHRDCPPVIYSDIMAIRAAEKAMKHGSAGDAVSLWLAANNKREVQVPQGEVGYPYADLTAHYWNVRIGAQHLNAVIRRAMADGDGHTSIDPAQRSVHTLIALKAIKSMAEISGQSNMAGSQLIEAMRYPDRTVRYEAALALAGGLPQRPFPGQERVIVLLGEALAQTGTPGVLILANQPGDVQKIQTALKDKFRTAGGTSAVQVIAESGTLPSVDAILVSEDVNPEELRKLFATAGDSARLDHSAKVVMVASKGSPWFRAALGDQRLSATTATRCWRSMKARCGCPAARWTRCRARSWARAARWWSRRSQTRSCCCWRAVPLRSRYSGTGRS